MKNWVENFKKKNFSLGVQIRNPGYLDLDSTPGWNLEDELYFPVRVVRVQESLPQRQISLQSFSTDQVKAPFLLSDLTLKSI